MNNDLKYRLIGKKFREFFLPTLSMALANNMALFVDSVLVSRLLGISRMPAIQLCSPIVTFVNLVYWMLGLGGACSPPTPRRTTTARRPTACSRPPCSR